MNDVLRAADALADAAEALRDGTSTNRRANLTVALDAYRAARDAAPAAEGDRCPATGVVWNDKRARAAILRALTGSGVEDDFDVDGLADDIMLCLRGDEHLVGDRSFRIARERRAAAGPRAEEVYRLRAELADREDLMEMAQQEMDRLRGMNKRLRAALAETRAAGDALAHQATELTIYLQGVPNVGSSRSRLSAWIEQWRSIRGDAPDDTSSEQE